MALNTKLTSAVANAQADALASLLNNGYLSIYDGEQPASADDDLTSQVLLAELRFGSPAFLPAADGIITANAITPDLNARETGTATWFRCYRADGTTRVLDGSAGLLGCNLILNSVDIQIGSEVSVNSFQHTVPK